MANVLKTYTLVEYLEELRPDYTPSVKVLRPLQGQPGLVLSGITCARKNYMGSILTASGQYASCRSATTRDPRPNDGVMEQYGLEYDFYDITRMVGAVVTGELIEYGPTFHGNTYGLPVQSVLDVLGSGRTPVLDIDISSAEGLMDEWNGLHGVFIVPESMESYLPRLMKRNQDNVDAQEIVGRLVIALAELRVLLDSKKIMPIINDKHSVHNINEYMRTGYNETAARMTKLKVGWFYEQLFYLTQAEPDLLAGYEYVDCLTQWLGGNADDLRCMFERAVGAVSAGSLVS